MTNEEQKELAKSLIEAGYANDKPKDEVLMDMFAAKIPFSKLNTLYKTISIDLGLIVDPKVVTDAVNDLIVNVQWATYTVWSEIEDVIEKLVDEVDGAEPGRVLTLIKSYCKDEEIKLPVKERAASNRTKGGKVPAAMAQLFADNANPTKQEFYDVVRPLVKGHKNAIDYMNMFFGLCLAVKQGSSLKDIASTLKSQDTPTNNEEADLVESLESVSEDSEPAMA